MCADDSFDLPANRSAHRTTSTTTPTSLGKFPFSFLTLSRKGTFPFPFYIIIGGFYRPLPKTSLKKGLVVGPCWYCLCALAWSAFAISSLPVRSSTSLYHQTITNKGHIPSRY